MCVCVYLYVCVYVYIYIYILALFYTIVLFLQFLIVNIIFEHHLNLNVRKFPIFEIKQHKRLTEYRYPNISFNFEFSKIQEIFLASGKEIFVLFCFVS